LSSALKATRKIKLIYSVTGTFF